MSDSQENQKLFEQLWSDFLEGEWDEAGLERLRCLLAADPALSEWAVEVYQTHRLLGLLIQDDVIEQQCFVAQTMDQVRYARQNVTQQNFTTRAMQRIREHSQKSAEDCRGPVPLNSWRTTAVEGTVKKPSRLPSRKKWTGGVIVLLCLLSLVVGMFLRDDSTTVVNHTETASEPKSTPETIQPPPVRFSRLAQARFFGELSPALQSLAQWDKSYILVSGMVELLFPNGAQAIIEGPAVFQAQRDNCLQVSLGRCSVHAPAGAEGFRVITPDTQVVDRGTRFSIDVNESNETEIQVIEGLADIYQGETQPPASSSFPEVRETNNGEGAESSAPQQLRLTSQKAVRVSATPDFSIQPKLYDAGKYRKELPDRVISYTATPSTKDGRAEFLETVTVQRGGREITYSVDELIPVDLTWFSAPHEDHRLDHLLGGAEYSADLLRAMSDHSLASGVINPGSSQVPLSQPPVMNQAPELGIRGTAGMAVKFRQPVVNGPGPDIVFWEIHPIPSPTDGDAFHVSPLPLTHGRKSFTVNEYDLSLYSPEALPVTRMQVHEATGAPIQSLKELQQAEFVIRPVRLDYRALAVAIDLSALGVAEGETVEGLFLQDAADGEGCVDPVLIGGLPTSPDDLAP